MTMPTNTERIRALEDRMLRVEMWVGGIRWLVGIAGAALVLDFLSSLVQLWKGTP